MSDLLSKTLIFATGATIGSVIAWYLTKKKYEPIDWETNEELNEDVEELNKGNTTSESELVQYNKYVKNYSGENIEEEKEEQNMDKPYCITADEYAELDDYNLVSLDYYEDDVLTDELGNVIDDVEEIVGKNNLAEFKNTNEDTIYIRNDALMSDYEILRNIGCFYDEHAKEA